MSMVIGDIDCHGGESGILKRSDIYVKLNCKIEFTHEITKILDSLEYLSYKAAAEGFACPAGLGMNASRDMLRYKQCARINLEF